MIPNGRTRQDVATPLPDFDGEDKGAGVVFFTVEATAAILSPYDEPKIDSRPLIFTIPEHPRTKD